MNSIILDHIVSNYHCYPGETLTFSTRLQAEAELPTATLQISLPRLLSLGKSGSQSGGVPEVEYDLEEYRLSWQLRPVEAGRDYEYRVEVIVDPEVGTDLQLVSRAMILDRSADPLVDVGVAVAVKAKAQSLSYLPAIYDGDEVINRFLMLFESFWGPLERQINNIPYYLDPDLTPAHFLPWLASWVDLTFATHWTEAQRRALLRSAVSLYRKRGTKGALKEYLEIYTGQTPEIIEKQANNFRLKRVPVGRGAALGANNQPHTFIVKLRLPPFSTELPPAEREQRELERHRTIERIIEAEKPAHTGFTLEILEKI
jgi:phage tail-like protein